ncbi:MAG TPA: hypothetical protein DEV97_09585 [Lachnospiraceae bacterium]|nr:hypothetical protein [Lachnospiraceae bacterium]
MKTNTFRRVLMALVLALATLLAVSSMSEPVLAASKKVTCVKKSRKKAKKNKKVRKTKKAKKTKKTAKKAKKSARKTRKSTKKAKKTTAKKQAVKVLSAENPAAEASSYANENVAGLYGNGQDITFSINGQQVTGHFDAQMSMQLVQMLNSYRASHGLGTLATTTALANAAMTRSKEITVVFDHVRPNGSICFTVSSAVSGENIAAGYENAQSFMNGWMNSPSHNANMLNGSFKAIGISVFAAKTAYGYTYFAVQNFGR